MELQPLNNYILVQYAQEQETQTSSGLYVPPTKDNDAFGFLRAGKVLAVSPKVEDIKEGETVLFNKNARSNIPDAKDRYLLRVEDVYAKVLS